MSTNLFNRKDNIEMLWDLISEEEIFKFLTPEIQSNVYNVFINNSKGFYEVEKTKLQTLVELNKKYIVLILNYIRRNYPYQPSKIVIHNEPPTKELITYEEIQNERKSKLEKDFTRRQEEFEDSMTLKAPPVPEFSDRDVDKPIKEMDKILKEMQAQRNYEVEHINRRYESSDKVDNWLKPQETSLKNEKYKDGSDKQQNQNSDTSNKFRFLNKLEDENEVNNSPNKSLPKNNVSWNNNIEVRTFNVDDDEDTSIFSKLKKVNGAVTDENDRISKLEINIKNLNDKMDKIIDLLNKIKN